MINSIEKKYLKKLISKYSQKKPLLKNEYTLVGDAFETNDIISAAETLIKGKITMSEITKKFEIEFAKFFKIKHALMVNSGSSANLLSMFALINPKNKTMLKPGDECIVSALCWSTSLWPIIQAGLKPIFVDIDLKTFNIDLDDLEKKITKKTKAIGAVHVQGNSTNMDRFYSIVKNNKLELIEDTCESLGSKYNNKYLGTFGRFGTFSFYVSHQISAGEGGMIICNNSEDYKIIHSLRAHGWDRGLNKKKNSSFNFINSGFNLRPLDLTAAIGYSQFKRLKKMIKNRNENRNKIISSVKNSKNWANQISFLEPTKKLKPSWFGLPILINKKFLKYKKQYLKHLNNQGIDTRPIISGNFLNQPSIKLYGLNKNKKIFKNAQEVEERGFFIGLHAKKIEERQILHLTNNLLKIN